MSSFLKIYHTFFFLFNRVDTMPRNDANTNPEKKKKKTLAVFIPSFWLVCFEPSGYYWYKQVSKYSQNCLRNVCYGMLECDRHVTCENVLSVCGGNAEEIFAAATKCNDMTPTEELKNQKKFSIYIERFSLVCLSAQFGQIILGWTILFNPYNATEVCSRWHSEIDCCFRENNTWHFMWTVCKADDSHEMSSIIFFENYCCFCYFCSFFFFFFIFCLCFLLFFRLFVCLLFFHIVVCCRYDSRFKG